MEIICKKNTYFLQKSLCFLYLLFTFYVRYDILYIVETVYGSLHVWRCTCWKKNINM